MDPWTQRYRRANNAMVARPGKLHTNDSQDKMWAGANLGLDCAKRSRPKLTEMAMDHVYDVLYDYGVA